jgi:hypothetical protein
VRTSNRTAGSTAKTDRINLILELRQAQRQFAQLLQQRSGRSRPTRLALLPAMRELWAMSRALALIALESTQ